MTPLFLTGDAIDTASMVKAIRRDSDGACVVFEGIVRNHHEGRSVQSIFYDAYRPMAEKEAAKIVAAVRLEWPSVAVAIRHRLGLLEVGEASIVIVCASPHRAEAFDACRALIDRIKLTVPIWKKEKGPDGEEWIGWQGEPSA